MRQRPLADWRKASFVLSACALLSSADVALAQHRRPYEVPPGDLSSALRVFVRQTDRQILFFSHSVAGRRTVGFTGSATAPEALSRILSETGLTFRVLNAETLLVVEAPSNAGAQNTLRRGRADAPPTDGRPSAAPLELREVVVTATRIPQPANRVPLSITALTEQGLEQRGVRQISDLASTPSMTVSQTSPAVANITFRGVANTTSAITAPTTGFYLDDTPLHKRNVGGLIHNNGTPLPQLFDLDRVELLRGPQGTLFGSSSAGGTVRYISRQPSLSDFSAIGRLEVSTLEDGEPAVELAGAVGGPILADRLGFRASLYRRNTGGYIDYVSPYTREVRLNNVNSGRAEMLRLALTAASAAATRITLSYLTSGERVDSNVSSYSLPTYEPIIERPVCFDTSNITPERPVVNPRPIACDSPQVTFRREGGVYGPYPDIRPYDLLTAVDPSPAKTHMQVASLTVDHRIGEVSVRSISSYVDDQTSSRGFSGANEFNLRFVDALYGPTPPSTDFPEGGRFSQGLGLFAGLSAAGSEGGPIYGFGYGQNKRYGFTQELRLSSTSDARPISWVGGLFYSKMHGANRWYVLQNQELISQAFYGLTAAQRYSTGNLIDPIRGLPFLYDRQDSFLRDTELAGFAEVNLWVAPRLRLTGGVRLSRLNFGYDQQIWGAAAGFAVPTVGNRGISSGQTSQTPFTPKVAALYEISDDDLLYAVVAEGYRSGGVNGNLSPSLCDPVLERFGFNTSQVPRSFASDSVLSYEVGGKFKALRNRLELSADVYQIDWADIQTAVNFQGCGSPFVTNGGAGRVTGAELEGRAFFGQLLLEWSASYTDGRYRDERAIEGSAPGQKLLINQRGQPFTLPRWNLELGARYERSLRPGARLYAHIVWRWASPYASSAFGLPGYSPDSARVAAASRLNLRLGAHLGFMELALFGENLLGYRRGQIAGGRIACAPSGGSECAAFGRYNPLRIVNTRPPRRLGITASFRR